jgi:hypothetical protein
MHACCWRVTGKEDGTLKEDGILKLKEGNVREREIFKGRGSSAGRMCERERNVEGKEDVKGRKY